MVQNNATNMSNPVTVPQGGSGAASFTAFTVLCAGTTSTGNLQNVVSVGTSGQVLTSNGSSALPSFQTLSASTYSAQVSLTSLQVKSLNGTPITIVPAAGTNKVIFVISAAAKLNYGGTNVFTGGSSLSLYYTNNAGETLTNSYALTLTASSNQIGIATPTSTTGNLPSSTYKNKDVVISVSSTNFGGNAANDNTVDIYVNYIIFNV